MKEKQKQTWHNMQWRCLLICLTFFCIGQLQGQQKPNIIIFYVDDLGWMDLSCQGSSFYETPAIDKLADEGIRFTQAYTAHPRCVPARYALLTGKYPATAHIPNKGGLKPSDVTIAEELKGVGYKTIFAGKWHLIFKEGINNLPEYQGFDINIAGGKAGAPPTYFYPYRKGAKTAAGSKGLKKSEIHGLENGEAGEYLTDRLTDESVKVIENHIHNEPDQPFFLLLSHYGVHTPFEAKPELIQKYKNKLDSMSYSLPEYEKTVSGDNKLRHNYPVYAAMIESIDNSLAKITHTLNQLNISENTIIIFTSDNGGLSTRGNSRKLATSNYPLRNGKGWLYEGGIREAFIVKWPGVSSAGSISDDVISALDIYPTLLEIAGATNTNNSHLDGINITKAIKGEPFNRDTPLYWHSPMGRPNSTGDFNASAIRLGDYKLIDWYDNNSVELFDLKNDIGEQSDLSSINISKTKELKQLLDKWKKEQNVIEIDTSANRWYK